MEIPTDLTRWRKDQRTMLLARRLAMSRAQRAAWNQAITAHLAQGFPALRRLIVGFCWPYQGEFDARPFIRDLCHQGARVALPAVAAPRQPLQFLEWREGVAMKRGALGIPVPEGTAVLVPGALLVPPVGFSGQGGRLGYGGGYFDRTLAALSPRPLAIGVAYELSRMPTIHPQPHDIRMDFMVTEAGLHVVEPDGLRPVDAVECARCEALMIAARGLALKENL